MNNKFEITQKVKAIDNKPLPGNDTAPDLKIGEEYPIKGITVDSAGHQHLDVGLPSHLGYVRSYETKEHLPNGDQIHWCHPSRFELVT